MFMGPSDKDSASCWSRVVAVTLERGQIVITLWKQSRETQTECSVRIRLEGRQRHCMLLPSPLECSLHWSPAVPWGPPPALFPSSNP